MAIHESAPTRIVEVFADVTCPFAHVGLRRLIEERDRLGRDDVVVRVRAWPLELVNGVPLSVASVAEKVHLLRETVAPDLFVGFGPVRFPSTSLPALSLAACAYSVADQIGERASFALRAALFEEGRDVADPAELATIARCLDLPLPGPSAREAVHDDWHEGQRRGVTGSPHFFIDDQGFFCPALTIQRVNHQLRVSPNPEAFAAFLHATFAADPVATHDP